MKSRESSEKIKMGNLHPTRDLTYVTDTCQGFIEIYKSEILFGEVTNIGMNMEVSMEKLFEKIEKLTCNKTLIIDNDRIRPESSEVDRLFCDNTKAKKLMGWGNKISFDDGLRMTIKWIKKHLDLYDMNNYII